MLFVWIAPYLVLSCVSFFLDKVYVFWHLLRWTEHGELILFCRACDIHNARSKIVAILSGTLLLFDYCELGGRIMVLIRLRGACIILILASAVATLCVAFCEPWAALEGSRQWEVWLWVTMDLLLLVVHHHTRGELCVQHLSVQEIMSFFGRMRPWGMLLLIVSETELFVVWGSWNSWPCLLRRHVVVLIAVLARKLI